MPYLKYFVLIFIIFNSYLAIAGINQANQYYLQKNYSSALNEYSSLAKAGNVEAQVKLGIMYILGEGTSKNYSKAFELFDKAKSQGNAEAQYWYATCLLNGYGTEKLPEKSIEWFRKSANQANINAQNTLGILYMIGLGTKIDYAESFKWNTKAANSGIADAMYNLGQLYEKGIGTNEDSKKAVYWYEKAAKLGHSFAQFELGVAYANGLGGYDKNIDKAIFWYKKADENGETSAHINLANLYFERAEQLTGDAKQVSLNEGIKWLQKGAGQGDIRSLYYLSDKYFRGVGVAKDESHGLKLLTEAADKGYVLAQQSLGLYRQQKNLNTMTFKDGQIIRSTPENDEMLSKAVKNWELGAEKGGKVAIKELAFAYQDGLGVKKDYLKSAEYYIKLFKTGEETDYGVFSKFLELYRKGLAGDSQARRANELVEKAAEAGNTALMRFVGQCHCGQFGKADVENKDFLAWYLKAANKGDAKAKWVLAKLHADKKEYEQAAKYYQEIVDLPGMDVAKYNLAIMYIYGKGVEKNDTKAKELLLKIKDKEEDNPQLALARLYTNGSAEVKNLIKAQENYLLVANRQQYFPNNPDLIEASGRLAEMFFNGLGSLKDEKQAYFWKTLQLESVAKENQWKMEGDSGDCFHVEGRGFYGRPFEFVKAQQMDVNKNELVRFKEKLSIEEIKRIDFEVKHWIETHKTYDTKVKIN